MQRRQSRHAAFAFAAIVALGAGPAAAQSRPTQGWLGVNVITTASSGGARDYSVGSVVTGRRAAVSTHYPALPRVAAFGVEGGLTFVFGIGFGIRVEHVRYNDRVGLTVASGHPVIAGLVASDTETTDSDLQRTTSSVDLSMTWVVPVPNDAISLRISAGPSLFHVTQDFVSDVQFDRTANQSGTINTVDITGFSQEKGRSDWHGYNAGADVAVFFSRVVGFGTGLHFNKWLVSINNPLNGSDVGLKAGRITVSAGVRLRF
jgi:hypothetical protein